MLILLPCLIPRWYPWENPHGYASHGEFSLIVFWYLKWVIVHTEITKGYKATWIYDIWLYTNVYELHIFYIYTENYHRQMRIFQNSNWKETNIEPMWKINLDKNGNTHTNGIAHIKNTFRVSHDGTDHGTHTPFELCKSINCMMKPGLLMLR